MVDMENSLSQSLNSNMNESDNDEVYKAFKHRERIQIRWKRLVKVNSVMYLLTSIACLVYTYLFSSTHYKHNMAICIIGIVAALFGALTGFSMKDPFPFKIIAGFIVTGICTFIISLYVIIGLSKIVIQSIDVTYETQADNFTFKEVSRDVLMLHRF